MPNINIEISEELLKAIRMGCAESGETQAEFVGRLVKEGGYGDGRDGVRVRGSSARGKGEGRVVEAVSGAPEPTGSQPESSSVGGGVQEDRGRKRANEAGGKKCLTHGKVMKDFGNAWLCDGPPSHKELK